MRLLGETAIWIALLMSAWASIVYIVGSNRSRSDLITSGDRAIHVVAITTLIAAGVLLRGLIRHDFSMRYVATYSSVNLPRPYLVAALWSGQRGSLLIAVVVLSILSVVAIAAARRSAQRLHAALLSLILVVAVAALCIALDPLGGLAWVPVDGIGMSPALQSPAAVLFPPLLIVAYTTYVVAGTRALACVLAGSIDRGALNSITRWAAAAWVLNTLGLLAGIWWSYREPSRSGNWTMLAFESGAILPWLAATAFLALLVLRSNRESIPTWSIALVTGATLLAGPAAALTTATVAGAAASAARSGLFITACIGVALGIGACAFLAARKLARPPAPMGGRRVYAIVLVVIAVVMIATSIAGSSFSTRATTRVSVAEPAEVIDATGARWAFLSQGLSSFNALNRQVTALGLEVQRDETAAGLLSAEIRQYLDVQGEPVFQPSREPAVRSSLREDVHVVMREIAEDDSATLVITIAPLMAWLWIGGALLTLGGLLAVWPQHEIEADA